MIARRTLLAGMAAGLTAAVAGPLAAAPLAKVKANGVLRVAVYNDNRPWSWDEGGTIRGIDADLARALADALGVKLDLALLIAADDVEADLRNAVWRGGLLGFAPADVMLHVPYDHGLAKQVDNAVLLAPYARERFAIACAGGVGLDCEAIPSQFAGHKLGVEAASLPDNYLMGQFGGVLAKDVTHFATGNKAVAAFADGKLDLVMATAAEVEHGLKDKPGGYHLRKGPIPLLTASGWDIGMAVKENSRTLGDALEDIATDMAHDGRLKAIFAAYGVTWQPALQAG